jgi:hypothetical protein
LALPASNTSQANLKNLAKARVNTACLITAGKRPAAKGVKLQKDSPATVAPSPSDTSFWRAVKQEAIAGLVVLLAGGGITGIGYLVYTVPSQLDRVIQNQEQFKTRVGELEDTVKDHDVRIIKLEMRR